jgi:hypothetical protein
VGSYNGAVKKHANRLGLPNGWHTRFRGHILRNDVAYQRIAHYIAHNPEIWEKDWFGVDNTSGKLK